MRDPVESFARIAELMERSMAEPDLRNARGWLIQAHTIAVLQETWLRRDAVRSDLAAHLQGGGALQ
jgi:hypothetical protein